ncbi:MAG: glycosyltransferase [Lentisphaerae bacterium]|nr:MAG: glycosyltransferase [Lentisphaerota bacterium]
MKILLLSQGTGYPNDTTFRDTALMSSLQRIGHDVRLWSLQDTLIYEGDGDEEQMVPRMLDARDLYFRFRYGALTRWLPLRLQRKMAREVTLPRARHWLTNLPHGQRLCFLRELLRGYRGCFRSFFKEAVALIGKETPDVVALSSLWYTGLIEPLKLHTQSLVVVLLPATLNPETLPADKRLLLNIGHHLRRADTIFAASEFHKRWACQTFELTEETVHVMYDGILLNYYRPRLMAPANGRIGYYGEITPQAGLKKLVECWLRVREHFPDCELHIGGILHGTHRQFLSELAKSAGAKQQKSIYVFPNLPFSEKRSFLNNLSLLAIPPGSELFNNVILEAMALQVPVVVPDRGMYAEILHLTQGGILYNDEDLNSMVDATLNILQDTDWAETKGTNGRKGVVDFFTSEQMVGRFLQVVRQHLVQRG